MAKGLAHIEKSRSWWRGKSTTYCGITFDHRQMDVYGWFSGRKDCPACKTALKGR